MAEENGSEKPVQVFTSADRIRQLNEIDKDVAKLIHSAGLAIQALTNARSNDPSSADNSVDSHKARFKEATSQYFALLSSIDVRLRRQVYALEEASILVPDSSKTGDLSGSAAAAAGASNPLDVSWLNSRKDTVGKEKEAELWAAARQFVERINQAHPREQTGVKGEGDLESMEVD
ncbi:hypothetical protein ASPSYDRAFT_55118 [Aspergillus sydowii CBS 593.65]|uniref:Mediator of RNA polymerase II transcription subunit 11 n=1 Tax=Aspergillus sydowii CBS 593.65 TaxID=1036612 RepID=A0A1L9TS10_9EURO|nr:uncharacterized protein ASPSYDRAFT_55118 [Aspergillus sydowii CBS 593.65]OJJ62201.1 hypothetical protein ASPSYDRAFT_55118 [Aspergillus sydowii CBS 593.65]